MGGPVRIGGIVLFVRHATRWAGCCLLSSCMAASVAIGWKVAVALCSCRAFFAAAYRK
jgi:hypothetical protein